MSRLTEHSPSSILPRDVIYASQGPDFATAARFAVAKLR